MTKIHDMLIRGAEVWQGGRFVKTDILIRDGVIQSIGDVQETTDVTIDGTGLHIMPGLTDLHVHFREPGFEYKETIHTGSLAAAKGGFTTVCTMPNLNPAPDSMPTLEKQLDIIQREAVVDVLPYATITKGRIGKEPVDYTELAPLVAGFSDDGSGVQDEEVMREAMSGVADTGKMLAAHCEVNSLLRGGYIHDGEWAREHGHRGICSESEWKEVERDIKLAEETGCKLHICHVSTKESVELVRQAKKRGVKVTCETGPHYLTFCDEDMQEDGRFKMNPPLRSRQDMEALRAGVIDGTIDAIATDHAPHSAEEKSRGLEKSAMGVVGLETSLAATYTAMVCSGLMTPERLVEVMADKPAALLGRDKSIREGSKADFVVVDFNKKFIVNPDEFVSKGKSTPFDGVELQGVVMMTVHDGSIVYKSKEMEEITTSRHREIRGVYMVEDNRQLAPKTWMMRLLGDTTEFTAPGQFVNVAIPGKFLRRPISVSDYDKDGLTLLYDVVGEGTEWMSRLKPTDKVDLLVGLGNGFSIEEGVKNPVLLGGGIGTAPLLGLTRTLKRNGVEPTVILGHNTAADVAMKDMFEEAGVTVYVSTVDGSFGTKGFVTDVIREKNLHPDYFYACGPMPMMRAVATALDCPGQLSLEARMGCGFGACVCCSLETTKGSKRICKEGPVFRKEELIWK